MTNILETVSKDQQSFTPTKPQEFLALQLARRLNDLDSLREYLILFEHYSEQVLLSSFRKCLEQERRTGPDFMRIFRELTGQNL